MPIAKLKNINTISMVSRTAVRNLIILIAPTKPKALARLLPITNITNAEIIVNMTIALTNDTEYEGTFISYSINH
jgi:hypothetical protein